MGSLDGNRWPQIACIILLITGIGFSGYFVVDYFVDGDCSNPAKDKRIALSFDDKAHLERWNSTMPLFDQYGVNVTFFIDRQESLSDEDYVTLHSFENQGHEIGLHTLTHSSLVTFVEEGGSEEEWFQSQVITSLSIMEDNDFEIDSFAYPFGARTDSMDDLIQTKIPIVRGVGYSSSSIFGDEIHPWHTDCLDTGGFKALKISGQESHLENVLLTIDEEEEGTILLYAHDINGTRDTISHEDLSRLFEMANSNGWEFIQMRDLR
jgi:peptidoglycan/xylan/chitin deacetylase (PgdA/CDA1 family)